MMKRKSVRVILLVVGIILCTGPAWAFLVASSGMVHAFQGAGAGGRGAPPDLAREWDVVMPVAFAGWIALPLGLAIVIWAILRLAGVRKKWVVLVGAAAPIVLGGAILLSPAGSLLLITGIFAEQNSGPFDQARFAAIVEQVKAIGIQPGESLELRLDDITNPKSLRRVKLNEIFDRGYGAGNVWAARAADGSLAIVVETRDLGHAGEYGFAYTGTSPPTPISDWATDLPGPLNRVDKKIGDHWWAVDNPLMD
jgi:hypothetical protein